MVYDDSTANRIEHFALSIEGRAEILRCAADALDLHAKRARTVGTPAFRGIEQADNMAWIAHEVQSEVLNALTDLRLPYLTTSAYDVDEMIRERKG